MVQMWEAVKEVLISKILMKCHRYSLEVGDCNFHRHHMVKIVPYVLFIYMYSLFFFTVNYYTFYQSELLTNRNVFLKS